MSRVLLPLLILILVVMQGMAMNLLPPALIYSDLLFTPHWALVLIVLISMFYDRDDTYYSVLYGVIFGFLIDMIYTDILGVYMFTYGIVIYIIHGLKKMLHANFIVAVLLGALALILADFCLYMMYYTVQIVDVQLQEYVLIRLLPTTIANIIFFIVLYPFVKERMEMWSEQIGQP
ncbi:rod shape-determining protein MreD [Thalassobacillus sp. CUG 92003]|uniref:rod shape-determining protein MreD n=1 Tax=Thalassobacillus sp. CUG 92003 TaxID=2736641 RepID=UPI0015E7D52E|nr:rod shape-determining protein MreD [Thalassobacillus sp. CUG 92003]